MTTTATPAPAPPAPRGERPIHARFAGALFSATRRRGAIIVCFHQVEAGWFVARVEEWLRYFRLVSMDELVERHARGRPLDSLLAITFDDGWRTTCEPIAPLCEQRGWPITIYLMSARLDGVDRFWFAEFPALLRACAGRRAAFAGHLLDLRGAGRAAAAGALHGRLRAMPNAEALAVMDGLRADLGLAPPPRRPSPFVDRAFVERHARGGAVDFGSHTVDHRCVSAQPADELRRQLLRSRERLEAVTGRRPRHFCYPYGDPRAVGPAAPAIVAGFYRSATTMSRGICDHGASPWLLPRIAIYPKDAPLRAHAKLAVAAWK